MNKSITGHCSVDSLIRAACGAFPFVEQCLRLWAHEFAFDYDIALADFFHLQVGDGQLAEACLVCVVDDCPEDDTRDSRPVYGCETHRARLGGAVDNAPGQVDGV